MNSMTKEKNQDSCERTIIMAPLKFKGSIRMTLINLKEIARDHRLECETYNTELKNITLWGCALLLKMQWPLQLCPSIG